MLSSPAPDLRRRFNLGLALIGVSVAVLALFLALPLEGANLHPALLDVQRRLRDAIVLLAPFAAVGALGAGVGLAELTSAFNEYPREAVASRWGQYLVGLNALAAVGAYLVARLYAPASIDPLALILGVGVGFPTLIRTKFTLARQFGGTGQPDLTIDVGWLYEQFQRLCKDQIDIELMAYRRRFVDRLLARFTSVQELYQTAQYTLNARATLTPEQEAARLEELKRAIDPKVPPELARLNLGLLVLELGGVAYVDLLAQARLPVDSSHGGGDAPQPEAVVKQLTERPLPQLKQAALGVLKTDEEKDRVAALAAPVPGIPEITQRASIARYLVDRLGAESASRLGE
jgi:hypothetical protein